jgi:hypothetical protein
VLEGFFFVFKASQFAYPNEIAAFIAAFFIARPFGRVPLDRMLVKLEVSRGAELFQPARVAKTWV